jgi:hypothetical protein
LALGPNQNLLLGGGPAKIRLGGKAISAIMDANDGTILETLQSIGASDQVWFNPGDNRFYISAQYMTSDGTNKGTPTPVFGVVDAVANRWLVNVPTAPGSHSIASDSTNNHVFVALRGGGVGVFAETE